MKKNENVGIINEQGFAAGFGLGFEELSKKDSNKIKNEQDRQQESKTKK